MDIGIRIVPMNFCYRGVDRDSILNEPSFEKSKYFDELLEGYFSYIDNDGSETLDYKDFYLKIYPFYKKLRKANVFCEIIAYSEEEISEFDKNLELIFMGYDIVNPENESLMAWNKSFNMVKPLLNCYGLCDNLKNIEKVKTILSFDLCGFEWTKCFVYKIVTEFD